MDYDTYISKVGRTNEDSQAKPRISVVEQMKTVKPNLELVFLLMEKDYCPLHQRRAQ